MRCFITGGTGFVGSHLAEACLARGWDVTCLIRSPQRPGWLTGSGIRTLPGSLDDVSPLARVIAGSEVVFHVAGLIKARAETDYLRVNFQGTENLVRACLLDGGPRRLVFVSSQAAVGPSLDGQPVSEDMPCNPVSPYGLSKLRGEVAALSHSLELPATIIRPPTIYGPRDREGLAMFRLIAAGVRLRPAVAAISIIHVRDLVEAIISASTSNVAAGRTYFVANPEPVTLPELGALISRTLGRRSIELAVPSGLLWTAGMAAETAGRLLGRPMIFDRHKAIEMMQPGWICSSTRAMEELTWRPNIDLADGIAETTRWYRANKWL